VLAMRERYRAATGRAEKEALLDELAGGGWLWSLACDHVDDRYTVTRRSAAREAPGQAARLSATG